MLRLYRRERTRLSAAEARLRLSAMGIKIADILPRAITYVDERQCKLGDERLAS
jgi:hypothetical protein